VATAGFAGFVDAFGRVSHLSHATENVVLGDILPRHHLSMYTRYGDWFVVACGMWALVALFLTRRSRQQACALVAKTESEHLVSLSVPFVAQQLGREQRDAVEKRAG